MTHVGDRMAMLRFQSNRPYTWRSGGSGYGGCHCGGGFSIFGNYGMGQMFRPMGFGFGCGNMFRAGFITNMVFGCLDYALNWTSQILGWFGIGNRAPIQQPILPNGQMSDLDALKQVFSDASLVRDLGNGKYEIVVGGKQYVGTYDEIMTATGKKQGTSTNTSTSTTTNTSTSTTTNTSTSTTTNTSTSTSTNTSTVTSTITTTNTKIQEAKTNGQVNLPNGYQLGETTVSEDGKVTITVKYTENNKEKTIQVTGDDADKALAALIDKCKELQKGVAEAKLAGQQPPITAPTGYKIEASGVDKNGKTKEVYVLVDAQGKKTEFDSIDKLKAKIDQIIKANTTPPKSGAKAKGNIETPPKSGAKAKENIETQHIPTDEELVAEWNNKHPNNQIRVENGKYVTTVQVYTNLGLQKGDVSGATFAELETAAKKKAAELEKICHKPKGGYTRETGYHAMGRAMQIK